MPLKLTSPEFQHSGDIPKRFTREGDDVSPPLSWSGVPTGTKSLAVVMEGRDAPPKKPSVHWVIYGIPADATSLPEDIPTGPTLEGGLVQAQNDFKALGYSGPCPSPGLTHWYYFTLYALNSELKLPSSSPKNDVVKAIKDHTVALAKLTGRFKYTGVQEKSNPQIVTKQVQGTQSAGNPPIEPQSRIQRLEQDKVYVYQLDQLQKRLDKAHSADSDAVKDFFRRYVPSPFGMAKVRILLRGIDDPDVRRALEDYVKFANRFRVKLRLKTNPLEFTPIVRPTHGEKFHVKYVGAGRSKEEKGEHLEPANGVVSSTDLFVDTFEDDNLQVPEAIQKLIDEGKVTFVQIEDGQGYSILKDLESFAYRDDGIAIIQHNAEQPYFICIFGENAKKTLFPRLGTAFSEFQRTHFKRGHGGRHPRMEGLKRELAIDRKPISNKAKAAELAEGGDEKKIKTKEVKLSKLHRKTRE
jgi:hypothetical protein